MTKDNKITKNDRCITPSTFCDLVMELGKIKAGEVGRVDFSKLSSKQVAKSVLGLFGIESQEIGENQADFLINDESENAFLRSIGRYCSNDLRIIEKWERESTDVIDDVVTNNLYYGTDLLFDMEYKRVYKHKDDVPLDEVHIVLAVIKAKVEGSRRDRYLFTYNSKALKYQMVGGYKLEDETSEQSVSRHLEKELINFEFDPNKHKLTSVYKGVETRRISRRRGTYTKYIIDVFFVEGIDEVLEVDNKFNWITLDEIVNGISTDGYSILWAVGDNENEGYKALRKLSLSTDIVQKEGPKKIKDFLTVTLAEKMLNKLLVQEESRTLEFKSSIRWDYNTNKINKDLEKTVLKSIVAFMNSDGGSLVLGVNDDKEMIGLRNDIKTLRSKNIDGLIQYITGLFSSFIGSEYARLITMQPLEVEDRTVCLIRVERSNEPVFLTEGEVSSFFVRAGNTTRQLNSKETYKYIVRNWET